MLLYDSLKITLSKIMKDFTKEFQPWWVSQSHLYFPIPCFLVSILM